MRRKTHLATGIAVVLLLLGSMLVVGLIAALFLL